MKLYVKSNEEVNPIDETILEATIDIYANLFIFEAVLNNLEDVAASKKTKRAKKLKQNKVIKQEIVENKITQEIIKLKDHILKILKDKGFRFIRTRFSPYSSETDEIGYSLYCTYGYKYKDKIILKLNIRMSNHGAKSVVDRNADRLQRMKQEPEHEDVKKDQVDGRLLDVWYKEPKENNSKKTDIQYYIASDTDVEYHGPMNTIEALDASLNKRINDVIAEAIQNRGEDE